MDFSREQKDFCKMCTNFLGVKCPSSKPVGGTLLAGERGSAARFSER